MTWQLLRRFALGTALLGALSPAWGDPLVGMVDWRPDDRTLFCTPQQYICFQGRSSVEADAAQLVLTRDGQTIATTAGNGTGEFFFARLPGAPGSHAFKILAVKSGHSTQIASAAVAVIEKAPAEVTVRGVAGSDDETVSATLAPESAFKATRVRASFGGQSLQVSIGPGRPAKFLVPVSTAYPGPTPVTIDAMDDQGNRFELASSVIVVAARIDVKLPRSITLSGAADTFEVEPYLQMGADFRRVDYYAAPGVLDDEGRPPKAAKWIKVGSATQPPFIARLDFKALPDGEIIVRADGTLAGGKTYHTRLYPVSLRRTLITHMSRGR